LSNKYYTNRLYSITVVSQLKESRMDIATYIFNLFVGADGYDLLAAIVVGAGVAYSVLGEFKIRGVL
tara:strand:- start:679 stop:879 length:201 start_codon:yes stop_codon:yes gene_type:complete